MADLLRQQVEVHRIEHSEFLSDGGVRYRQSGLVEIPFLSQRGEPLMHELRHFAAASTTVAGRWSAARTAWPRCGCASRSATPPWSADMYKGQKIAAVVPAYNESQLIGKTITTMPDFVDIIVVVNDCSTDDTSERARGSR